MNLGSDVVITITGIVLVFAILVLLMLIIMLEGKIFDGMAAKKKAAKEPAAPKAAAKPAAPRAAGCSRPCGGGRHSRRCGCRNYGSHPCHGQWQVHPEGRAPCCKWLEQGWCQ